MCVSETYSPVGTELDTPAKQKEALHYVVCLLPRPNLNTLQVLLWFMEEVSFHAGVSQDWGNKMDLDNLATVMTPNILLSSAAAQADPSQPISENPYQAIHIVKLLFRHQHELWRVPPSILKALSGLLVDKSSTTTSPSSGQVPTVAPTSDGCLPISGSSVEPPLHEDAPQCREILRRYQLEILKSRNMGSGASAGMGHSGQQVS